MLARLWAFAEAPKARLPWPVLAALVVAGPLAGTTASEAGAPWWAAALVTLALSGGGALVLRRVLARRGAPAYDDLPTAKDEEGERGGWMLLVQLAERFVPWVVGLPVGAVFSALGLGDRDGEFVTAWVACGVVGGWPIFTELDIALALHLRRRRARATSRLEDAVSARGETVRPVAPGDPACVITVRRGRAVVMVLSASALAAACATFPFWAGAPKVVDVAAVGGAGFALYRVWLRWPLVRAPWYARFEHDGVDVLGTGPAPWHAVRGVTLRGGRGRRALLVSLRGRVRRRGPPWEAALPVEAPASLSSWPVEQVAAQFGAHGVPVDVDPR